MSTNADRIISQDANAAVRDSLIPRQTVVSQAVCLSSPQVAFSLLFFLLLTGTFNSTTSAMSFCTPAFAKAFKSIAINCFERLSFPIWAWITHTPQAGKAACTLCTLPLRPAIHRSAAHYRILNTNILFRTYGSDLCRRLIVLIVQFPSRH